MVRRFSLLVATLFLIGCPEASDEPPVVNTILEDEELDADADEDVVASPTRVAPSAPAPAEVDETPSVAVANLTTAHTLPEDMPAPWTTGRSAPALGVQPTPGLRIAVDPESGWVRTWETDAELGTAGIRRTRTTGHTTQGSFGQGWIAEFDARVFRAGKGFAVVRMQGTSAFVPTATAGSYVTPFGEVEYLRETASGYELISTLRRVLTFDHDGCLTRIEPGYRVERSADAVRLIGDRGALRLSLDAEGRVRRAQGAGVDLAYGYLQGELEQVTGTVRRSYGVEQGELVLVREGAQTLARFAYDGQGRPERIETAAGARTYHFESGAESGAEQVRMRGPRGEWTYTIRTGGWDVETPSGQVKTRFDARGRVARTFQHGFWTERSFDALGQDTPWLSGKWAPAATPEGRRAARNEAAAERDAAGRLLRLATPGERAWSFNYRNGRVVGMNGPMGRVRFERDRKGRVSSRKDASGRQLHYHFDEQGRVVEITTVDAETQTFTYGEDRYGLQLTDAHGTRRLTVVQGADSVRVETGEATLVYSQGEDGLHVATPFGSLRRQRDARGNVVELDTLAGPFRFGYDADGRRSGMAYPNGVVTRIARDRRGRESIRLSEAGEERVLALEIGRDRRGDRVRVRRDGQVATASYDEAGRLQAWSAGDERFAYGYDADGNRVRESRGDDTARVSFDERMRIERRGAERFRHDRAGRLIERTHADGRDRFDYDGFGRLVRVKRAGQPAVSYTYDPLGRWASRTQGERTVRYVYEGERLLAEVGEDESRYFAYGPATDEPLALWQDGAWTFLHANDLGHVLAYTDADGQRVASAAFGPFGEVLQAPEELPLFYAGRLVDPVTGLVNMRARVYDPSLGRFLTPDPSGLDGGLNAYAYADNTPLCKTDPTGLVPVPADTYGEPAPQAVGGLGVRVPSFPARTDAEAPIGVMDQAAQGAVLFGSSDLGFGASMFGIQIDEDLGLYPAGWHPPMALPPTDGLDPEPEYVDFTAGGYPGQYIERYQEYVDHLIQKAAKDRVVTPEERDEIDDAIQITKKLEKAGDLWEKEPEKAMGILGRLKVTTGDLPPEPSTYYDEDGSGSTGSDGSSDDGSTGGTGSSDDGSTGSTGSDDDDVSSSGEAELIDEFEESAREAEESVDGILAGAGAATDSAVDQANEAIESADERDPYASAREAARAYDARERERRQSMGTTNEPQQTIPVGIQPFSRTLGGGGGGGGSVGGGGAPTAAGAPAGAALPAPVVPSQPFAGSFDGDDLRGSLPGFPELIDALGEEAPVAEEPSDASENGGDDSVDPFAFDDAANRDEDSVLDEIVDGSSESTPASDESTESSTSGGNPGEPFLGDAAEATSVASSDEDSDEQSDDSPRFGGTSRVGGSTGAPLGGSRGAPVGARDDAEEARREVADADDQARDDEDADADTDGLNLADGRADEDEAEAETPVEPNPAARPPAGLTFDELAAWLPDHDGESRDDAVRALFGVLNRGGMATSWVELGLTLTQEELVLRPEGLPRDEVSALAQAAAGNQASSYFPREPKAFFEWAVESLPVGQTFVITGQGNQPRAFAAERVEEGIVVFDLQAKQPVQLHEMLALPEFRYVGAIYLKPVETAEAEAKTDAVDAPETEAESGDAEADLPGVSDW